MLRAYTRVAVVQLAFHPALLVQRRSPLSDPLFELGRGDSLLPEGGDVPETLRPSLDALRARIREAYAAQLIERVRAILAELRALSVRVAVFPEHSIPWELLGAVADAAGDVLVVAGSHTVERASLRSGVYERLGAPQSDIPDVGREVCPVLDRGRLTALVPALGRVAQGLAGQDQLSVDFDGAPWRPCATPDGVPGPMGVLPFNDFIRRDFEPFKGALEEPLAACRFVAVPSLSEAPENAGKRTWEEAKRFGKPVLHAAWAKSGGTSVFVDEPRSADLRFFPDQAGHLESGDEGVIVADVDLAHERSPHLRHFAGPRAIRPVAEASLVYRAHPVADTYAAWLGEVSPLLSSEGGKAAQSGAERVEAARDLLLNAGALSGAKARDRRLRRLLSELDNLTDVEELRQFTREIVLPPSVLPHQALRAALARGAADEIFAWLARADARAAGFGEVEARLRGESDRMVSDASSWTHAGTSAFAAVRQAVRRAPDAPGPPPPSEVGVRVFLPSGMDPSGLGVKSAGGFSFEFSDNPGDFLAGHARRADDVDRSERTRGEAPKKRAAAGPVMRGQAPNPTVARSFTYDFSEAHIWVARELHLLALAEGSPRAAVVGVRPDRAPSRGMQALDADALLVLSNKRGGGGWIAREAGRCLWLKAKWPLVRAALSVMGLVDVELDTIPAESYPARVNSLLARFDGGHDTIDALLAQRLREVSGHFVEPDVVVGGDSTRRPLLGALDDWLDSDVQAALLLGDFGAGKSTGLAEWAHQRWLAGPGPRPILVSLAQASRARDGQGLLLEAARAEDSPENRAALRLLIGRRLLLPCFDGFDELLARQGAAGLPARLSDLLATAGEQGKVVLTSRDAYFLADAGGASAAEGPKSARPASAIPAPPAMRRLTLQLFNDDQIRSLVEQIRGEASAAEESLEKIAQVYDLRELVRRPLLLGMVLATLDQIEPGSKVGTADLYEAYLSRWLAETRSDDPDSFTDEQKVELAESLAEQLWRSGRAACSWDELQGSVRARLASSLPHEAPKPAAFADFGGAFFVREGGDRFRFAHRSFLDYFMARSLVFAAPERPKEVLTTRPITPEVASFVGEILRRNGDPKGSPAVRRVQAWLAGEMVESWATDSSDMDRPGDLTSTSASASTSTSTLTSPPTSSIAVPAANAARLLLYLGRWAKDVTGWIPDGADLRGVQMEGEDLEGASLVRARLEGARLANANLRVSNLMEARLEGADLTGADLTGAILPQGSALYKRRVAFLPLTPDSSAPKALAASATSAAGRPQGSPVEIPQRSAAPAPPMRSPAAIPKPLPPPSPHQALEHRRSMDEAYAPPPAQPPILQNPFRPGPALTDQETLPGREAVIDELCALIDSRSPAVLRGPRRAGKTSILHSIERRLTSSGRPVLRVTLEATRVINPDDLALVLVPSLKGDPAPAEALRARLRAARRTTLLLDEVANLKGADPSVFAWLRAVGQEEASVVFAGSFWDWVMVLDRASSAPGSSFGNDVTPVSLGPIPAPDAVHFLVSRAPPDVPIEEERTARWIIELCGTWPFYLQVMGHAVVQATRAGNRSSLVERRGVHELYEQRLLVDRDAVFRGRFAELPDRARRILKPPPSPQTTTSQAARLPAYKDLPRDDRSILRDTGLCTPLGAWLDDPPFFDWIRRSADDHEGGTDSGSNVPR